MEKVAKDNNATFVALLGDNIYGGQVTKLKEMFETNYNSATLAKMPFYAVAGNQDHRGNVSAQIAYTNKSKQWVFPYYYYNKVFQIPGTAGKTLEIVMFDTVIAVRKNMARYRHLRKAHSEQHQPTAEEQWNWLSKTLSASTADYLWVGGHYPVYSACLRGPTARLVQRLKPKLEQYGAHYMSGHDHCQGHIDDGQGVQYVVAGAGMECCYEATHKDDVPANSIKFWMSGQGASSYQPMPHGLVPKAGFVSFKVGADNMTVSFHSHGGEEIYTTPPILPRNNASTPPILPRNNASTPPIPTRNNASTISPSHESYVVMYNENDNTMGYTENDNTMIYDENDNISAR